MEAISKYPVYLHDGTLFAIAIHLEIICEFHDIQASSNSYVRVRVVIHIDNKAVRQRSALT